jgi:hypothetical protein
MPCLSRTSRFYHRIILGELYRSFSSDVTSCMNVVIKFELLCQLLYFSKF